VWETGNPKREFLHVDDCADALVFLMNQYDGSDPINVGTGENISIGELAILVKETVGFSGGIRFGGAKPDGVERKLLDISRIRQMGWRHRIGLKEGLALTYRHFLKEMQQQSDTNPGVRK